MKSFATDSDEKPCADIEVATEIEFPVVNCAYAGPRTKGVHNNKQNLPQQKLSVPRELQKVRLRPFVVQSSLIGSSCCTASC